MLTRVQSTFDEKVYRLGKQGQLYIVPTLDGLKLLVLNLILLIIGLVYANNYVLLFNFILFCLFIGSMYYTHFNLRNLSLVSTKLNPVHNLEMTNLSLLFKSHSALGHHFIGIKLKHPNLIQPDTSFSFSLKENQTTGKIELPLQGAKRGVSVLQRIILETYFPFHLFRAFTYFDINLPIIVYPEKKLMDDYKVTEVADEKTGNEDDFFLKSFYPGDSLRRIHWKKYAQTGKLFTKQLYTTEELPVLLGFSAEDLTPAQKEKELCSICFGLHELHSAGLHYGLALDKISVEAGHSQQHLQNCLRALAEYET